MANRAREILGRLWSHYSGPITVRSIVFIAVLVVFFWAVFDRLSARDHNRAMQQRIDLYSIETQAGLAQIHRSWAKFDEVQKQLLANQRAMQDEISEQTAILSTERQVREQWLSRLRERQEARKAQANRIATRARRRAGARRVKPKRPRACFQLEDRTETFGNGAEVKRQILVSVPCP